MSTASSRSLRRPVSVLAAAALVVGGSVLSTATAAASTAPPIDTSGFDDGRYIVVLDGDGAATYQGGLPNLLPTAPVGAQSLDDGDADVVAYTEHIAEAQQEVADAVGASIETSLTLTMNGFVADLTVEEAQQLAIDPRVSSVIPDSMYHIDGSPSNEYLDVEGMYEQVGGDAEAGAGVVVGVIDTGIAPENPLFAGDPLGTTAGDEPYLDGDVITFVKGDGETFTGTCQPGQGEYADDFTADMCSTKIVSARYYYDGWAATGDPLGTEVGETISPRDGSDHGSHTASTAAGNYEVPITSIGGEDLGTMSGVAPAARIAAYKACWEGPDPLVTDDDGCTGTDLLAAVEQAVADGVDVINYSIGGGADDTNVDAVDLAFLGAAAAGVFVTASAGNDGPGDSTLDHAEPWLTTVANTTIPNYEATITLDDGSLVPGGSVTVPFDGTEVSGPFVYAGDIAAAGVDPADAALCLADTLDPALAAGAIVMCDRGVNARVEKSEVVEAAGGIGVVLANTTVGESIDLDDHVIPTVHTDGSFHDQLLAAAQTDGATVTFTVGNTSGIETPAPIVAGSSSRGPALTAGSDLIKPDIAAPGTGIIAAGRNDVGADPRFVFLTGTSMAAPHVAGLAAVYLGANPEATPAEIKSALMTTATDTVNPDGTPSQDWFAQGAGFVNTAAFLDAGVYYANDTADWYGFLRGQGYTLPDEWVGSPIDASDLNLASIGIGSLTGPQTVTRTLTALEPGSYAVSVDAPAGVDVSVSPTALEFTEVGQELSYTVTFTPTASVVGDAWATGSLTWTSAEHTARSPIAVFPQAVAAPTWLEGQDTSGSVGYSLTAGQTGAIDLSANGLFPLEELGTGEGTPGQAWTQDITIGEGELAHYFTLDGDSDVADLDLYVQRLNDAGQPVQQWVDGNVSADELLLLENPQPASYRVIVRFYSAEGGQSTAFTLDHVSVTSGAGEGSFEVEPTSVAGEVAQSADVEASWQGLELDQEYLGVVTYSTSDLARTYVHVTSGEVGMPAPTRISGASRYSTAVAASQLSYPDGADVVYIASGETFPDGLSAGPAAAHEDAPLLLTPSSRALAGVLDEIERLAPSRIVIVGGTSAISQTVEDALEGMADTVDRIAGVNRYDTSRQIAEYAFTEGAGQALIATGRDFPDALAAGAAGGAIDAPVLLVNGTSASLDDATLATLDGLGVTQTFVAGGVQSVSNGIFKDLTNASYYPQRISGADRYLTGVAIAQAFFSAPVPAMYVASGQNFPDALAGSALAGAQGAPLYVVPGTCVPSDVVTDSLRLGQPDVYLMGGPATLGDGVASYQTCG